MKLFNPFSKARASVFWPEIKGLNKLLETLEKIKLIFRFEIITVEK